MEQCDCAIVEYVWLAEGLVEKSARHDSRERNEATVG